MAESKRQQKFNRLLQKEIGAVLQKEGSALYGKGMVSVTGVKISPDLSSARVYLSLMLVDDRDTFVTKMNTEFKPKIKLELGKRIRNQVRIIPELSFFLDNSYEENKKMDDLFKGLDIPPEDEGADWDKDYKKPID